uniref:Uncharacterized protein n=1 Tax=Oryza glumipatula TaxID=40148 RepID=A0A0D9Z9A1_9ORYZ
MSQSSFPSPFRSSDAAVDLRAPVALTCNTRPCCCCRCHCRRLCSLVASSSPDVTRNTRRHWQHSCRGRQPAAGTARFLETLIERADCRCGTSTLCSTTTLQSTDQECPFVEKLCSKSNSHLNAINYQLKYWKFTNSPVDVRRPQSVATTLSPPAPMRHGQSSDIEIFSPGGEEVRRRWREVVLRSQVRACQLRAYDALPAFLKHNEFIIDYYRSEWPIKQALLSAFVVHNETIFQT